ncbi:MAG TPA: cation:proton antiporter [Mesorhizobium sp.]|nr:cation:proton antiporter [Mesorhizobium sp.]
MSAYQFAALVVVVMGPVLALSRAVGAPPSLALFAAGLLSAFLPGLPPSRVDPQLALDLFLPPLVYASAVRVSFHLLRFTLVPGVLFGAAIVVATVALVGFAAWGLLLPGLPWTAALLLGIVASVFDTRLFHEAEGRPHVPRAIADTLKARELVSRLFILASLSLGLESATQAEFSLLAVLEHYALDIPAGIALGLVLGRLIVWARERIDPAPIEIALSVATPYAASLAAAALGVSGVAAITAAALVVSTIRIDRRTGAPISSSETRISAVAFWEEASLMISSALFFLAGRALPEALAALDDQPLPQLLAATLGVLAVVLAVQFALSYLSTFATAVASVLKARRAGEGPRRFAAAGVMAWSSTRSAIGLVIALSIPPTLPNGEPFAARELILVVAALMIVGSTLLQGMTLRFTVAWASLGGENEQDAEESRARQAMEAAHAAPGAENANGFDAARQALLRLREQNRIGDEVLVGMLRETDLSSRAAEGNALPGAGPPNP